MSDAPATLEAATPAPRPLRSDAAAQARVPLPPANADLTAWAAEQAAQDRAAPGRCWICKEGAARWACHGCAAPVCARDGWTMFGLCKRCARPEHMRRWHQQGRVEGGNWLAGG